MVGVGRYSQWLAGQQCTVESGIPPGLSASQGEGAARLVLVQPHKPYWSQGNTNSHLLCRDGHSFPTSGILISPTCSKSTEMLRRTNYAVARAGLFAHYK